jgi:hypothetical protein
MVNKIITIGIVIVLVLILILFSLKSSFTPIDYPEIASKSKVITPDDVLPTPPGPFNMYQFDSRYQFPTMPPVNPMVTGSLIYSKIPVSPELDPSTIGEQTNELDYSGGSSKLIKIPLQYNVDSDNPEKFEQLRSQDVLITPYNKIKYGSC